MAATSRARSVVSEPRRAAQPDRLGKETPRIFTPPLRRLTRKTSAGFACIDFAEQVLLITLAPWQKWLLIHALELLPDGTYRFRTVVVLVARQNGKSTLLTVLSLWRMFVDGAPLVIGTAQNLDVAEEQWQTAVDLAESVPELEAEIAKVDKTNGKKALRLVSGERYKVAAASRRGGRGLSGDLILLDELREHQTWEAWSAVTKTTMARALAQIWAASNAGDSASRVLGFLRLMAHMALGNPDDLPADEVEEPPDDEDGADSLGLFEWSAAPGCDKWDREAWAQANPSMGYGTTLGFGITERAIASAARTDPDDVFRTEVLCQWVDVPEIDQVIPAGSWAACLERDAQAQGHVAYSIDASPDGASASIAASDGLTSVVLEWGQGTSWVASKMAAILSERPGPVRLDPSSPAGALLVDLEAEGIDVLPVSPKEHAQACGGLLAAVVFQPSDTEPLRFQHTGQPHLDEAVRGATRRKYGDAWAWNRRSSTVDISPLVAVTIARWAALQAPEHKYDGPLVAVT